MASLLDSLRKAGAHELAATLTARLSAAGMFKFFLQQNGPRSVSLRTGGRRHPGRTMGSGDPDLWLFLNKVPGAETEEMT